jgi:hypothetical protein
VISRRVCLGIALGCMGCSTAVMLLIFFGPVKVAAFLLVCGAAVGVTLVLAMLTEGRP